MNNHKLYLKLDKDRWQHWKSYKTEQAAHNAAKSILSGETIPPDWFLKDLIKVCNNSSVSYYGQ